MKILIFSWRGPNHPNAGGAEIVTHEHAKYWARSGHDVTLFTSSFQNAKNKEIIDRIKIIRKGGQILGVQIEALKWYLFKNKENFDLVIDNFHGIPFFTPLYVKPKKLAFIHETAKEVWSLNQLKPPYNFIFGFLGPLLEPWIFKIFYKNTPFLTVSNSTKQDLVDWSIPKKNIKVIENGINLPKIKLEKRPKQKIVTFFGSLSRDKGIETAIEVFKKLSIKDSEINFWVIGKGESGYLKRIKGLAKKLNILNKIKFWGFVSETDKYKLLSKSSLIINPSAKEGWGLTVIEAASVGTPTIAFDVAGLRDSIKNKTTGILTKRKTSESMTEEVIKLLSDEKELVKLSEQSLEWSKNFSWKKSCKESLKFINAL